MRVAKAVFILCGIFCCSVLGRAWAEPMPVGTIRVVEGVCDLSRAGGAAAMIPESMPLFLHDRVRTKQYSKAEITLADKSVIRLAASSCVTVEEFGLDARQKRQICRVKLSRGKLEAVVSKTGAPDTFVIDTPNASGSVKGSDIFVSYLAGKTGVFVHEGAMSVGNPSLPDARARVTQGKCVLVPFDEAPGRVRYALDAELSRNRKEVEKELIKKWIPSQNAAAMGAQIFALSGQVRLFRKGAADWRAAQPQETLAEGDKLQTGVDGKAQIRLDNGNVLIVNQSTEVAVGTLRSEPRSGTFSNTFEMSYGKVNGIVEKMNGRSTFELKTPTVICGVRGTIMEVIAPAPAAPAAGTQVFYEGGNGVVTSISTGQIQDVAAGQNVLVDAAGTIAPPQQTTAEQRGVIVQTVASSAGAERLSSGSDSATVEGESASAAAEAAVSSSGEAPVASAGSDLGGAALLSTLTYDQVVAPASAADPSSTGPAVSYQVALPPDMHGGLVFLTPDMDIKLMSDHTWTAEIGKTQIGKYVGLAGAWTFSCTSGADQAVVSGNNFPATYTTTGSVSGTINGQPIVGTATLIYDASPTDDFDGTASGTWGS